MAGAGSSLLAFMIPTTFSVSLFNSDTPVHLPEPVGCMAAPLPEELPPPPPGGADFTVTVVTKNNTHPYFGVGWSQGFAINGVQGLELFLLRGTTYTFSISGGHPFAFTTSPVGGPANIASSYPNGNGITGTPTGSGPVTFTPNASHPSLIYYNCNAHENMGWKIHISDPTTLVAAKVMMEGPYNSGTLLMRDSLRVLGLVPFDEPYSDMGFPVITGTVAPSALAVTGVNALVDWVVLDLRSSSDPSVSIVKRAALVQRDGDVVATNGTSPVSLAVPAGNYYVAIRHRNHLGIMTASAVALSPIATTVDFTSAATLTFGGADQRRNVGGKMLMWGGDVAFDAQVQYTGAGSDRELILTAIGGVIPTATVVGQYRQEDITMDGTIKYTGGGNDRDVVLGAIGGVVPTNIRSSALP